MARLLLLAALFGASATVCFAVPEEYAPYVPPFSVAVTGERNPATRIVAGKNAVDFQGSALALRLFVNGEANVFSPDMKNRYGGLIVMSGSKALSGTRGSLLNEACDFTYSGHDGLIQRFMLRPDGRIWIALDNPPGHEPACWLLSLIGEFFGGMAIDLDGKRFRIRQYRNDVKFSDNIFEGAVRRAVFFPDASEKSFSIELPEGYRMKLTSSSERYGISLRITPPDGAAKMEMILEPGSVATCAEREPEGYTFKAGAYDFWAADRLRLPDRRGKNLLSNSSFEQGFAYLWFPHGGGLFSRKLWEVKPVRICASDAFEGSSSLEILSDAPSAELSQNVATHPTILPPDDYTVSFYAKTNCSGKQTLHLIIPELPPGANYWDPKNRIVHNFRLDSEWKRYSLTFKTNVTRPQYFQFSASSSAPAICRIDAMQLERGPSATAYAPAAAEGRLITSASDNFLEFGTYVDARLRISTAKPNEEGQVETIVRDFFGKERRRFLQPFSSDQNGKANVAIDLENLQRGIFTIENRYALPGGNECYEFTRLAVMNFLKNTHPLKSFFADSYIDPFGVRQYYPEVLERYRKIGIGARAAFANTEKLVADEAAKYGVDTFSTMLLRADTKLTQGLPTPCCGFTILNNIVWYETPSVGCRREDYATVVLPGASPEKLKEIEKAAARKSAEAPWVKIWGAINEAEGSMPEFAHSRFASEENYRQYVELELAVARGIKAGNPNAMVGNSSTSCLRQDRFETLEKLLTTIGDRFHYDCFIVHTYREAPEYPDLDADFETLFALLAHHGYKDTPVYCPEGMHWKPYRMPGLIHSDWIDVPWGPFSYDMGHAERISAAWRAREWLIGLKHQNRVKLMNSSTNFWGFDMDCELTPFANQKISNTLGRLLGDASFIKEIRYSPKVRCYLFEDGEKRPVAALWSCIPAVDRGEEIGPVLAFQEPPDVEMFDLMEAECAFPKSEKLRLDPFPVFLRGKPGCISQLVATLEAAELALVDEPAATHKFTVAPPDRFALAFSNGGRRTVSGVLEFEGKQEAINLKPGDSISFSGSLPAVLNSERLTFEPLRALFSQSEPYSGSFKLHSEFAGLIVRRAAIVVNGSTDDWRSLPLLDVSQRVSASKTTGNKSASPQHDFSAKLRVAWSPEKLFLLVEVVDDKLSVAPRARLGEGWRNDSLQLFIDPLNNGRTAEKPGTGFDDWSYGIYLDPETLKPYVYRHHVPDVQLTEGFNGARADTLDTEAECVFRRTEGGYLWEVGLPLRSLLPLALKPGAQFGLGVMLNNQDSDSAMPQSRLVWGTTAFPYNERPDLWPLAILGE